MSEGQTAPTQAALRRWHALGPEPTLDPDLPIIDAHVHLWDRPPERFTLGELGADVAASGHDVRAACFVECATMYRADGPEAERPIGETEWVAGLAAVDRTNCAAIISYADLRRDDLPALLDGHSAAGQGRFRGIRQQAQHDAALGPMTRRPVPAGLLADAAFRRGLCLLGESGLSFDAWVYFTQLRELADTARACPETTIVLDHLGGPLAIGPYAGGRAAHFARWRSGMAALADCPNIVVKIGGMGMPSYGHGFEGRARPPSSTELADAWRPHVETVLGLFGARRCMFESNFPVDAVSCGYGALWNAFKRLVAGASAEERRALFAGTAAKIYRIAGPL